MTVYSTILDCYSLADIIEYNDKTEEETLQFLIEDGYLVLPDIRPMDFDD